MRLKTWSILLVGSRTARQCGHGSSSSLLPARQGIGDPSHGTANLIEDLSRSTVTWLPLERLVNG